MRATTFRVAISLALTVGLAAGCGSASSSSSSTAPQQSPSSAQPVVGSVSSSLASTGPSSAATAPAGYCALAAEMGRPPMFDDLLSATGSTNAVKVSAAALRQSVTSTTPRAPAELSADFVTLGASYDRYFALLAKSGWNVGDLVQAIADPMSTTAVAYGKIDTAGSDQSAARVEAYNRANCNPKA